MRLHWELREGQMFAVWEGPHGLLVDGHYKEEANVLIHIPGPRRRAGERGRGQESMRSSHSR